MAYDVKTAVFEGPLDLLLQLVTRRQVDVASVSLEDLVGEYLRHIEQLRSLDLDVTSEFLLIAATLIQLKVRRLLPDDGEVDIDEELALIEERDRLLSRLLACATFKDVAAVLALRMAEAARHVPRTGGIDVTIRSSPPDVELGVDAAGLAHRAALVFDRSGRDPDLDHLDLDLPSVESAIDELRTRVVAAAQTTFDTMIEHCTRRVEIAAYFLAMLELARWGVIEVSQESWSGPIGMRAVPGAAMPDGGSEWSR